MVFLSPLIACYLIDGPQVLSTHRLPFHDTHDTSHPEKIALLHVWFLKFLRYFIVLLLSLLETYLLYPSSLFILVTTKSPPTFYPHLCIHALHSLYHRPSSPSSIPHPIRLAGPCTSCLIDVSASSPHSSPASPAHDHGQACSLRVISHIPFAAFTSVGGKGLLRAFHEP